MVANQVCFIKNYFIFFVFCFYDSMMSNSRPHTRTRTPDIRKVGMISRTRHRRYIHHTSDMWSGKWDTDLGPGLCWGRSSYDNVSGWWSLQQSQLLPSWPSSKSEGDIPHLPGERRRNLPQGTWRRWWSATYPAWWMEVGWVRLRVFLSVSEFDCVGCNGCWLLMNSPNQIYDHMKKII